MPDTLWGMATGDWPRKATRKLNVWAYCAYDWRKATRQAGGVIPVTSPPASTEDLDLTKAATADVVYLNLHGFMNQPYLYGQRGGTIGPTAMTANDVYLHDWRGSVVFAEVCFSAANGGGEIAKAFLKRGAAFIGSTTEAYGRLRMTLWDGVADRLFWLFRRVYERIRQPEKALEASKRLLRILSWPLDEYDRATLESFICLEK